MIDIRIIANSVFPVNSIPVTFPSGEKFMFFYIKQLRFLKFFVIIFAILQITETQIWKTSIEPNPAYGRDSLSIIF